MYTSQSKGLKKGAISRSAAIMIGLAATAPAYSLSGALGYGAAESGYQLPIVFILSVIPMFFVALSYKHLTTASPDSGTVFTWGTKALGPRFGWFGGWAMFLASILAGVTATQVIVNVTGVLLGIKHIPYWLNMLISIVFIASTTYLTVLGAKESSRVTILLTITQYGGLAILGIMLFTNIWRGDIVMSAQPLSWGWLNPFAIPSFTAFLNGFLIALFIFWGFDASLAMSEETEGDSEQAGYSGVIAIIITMITYVVFATLALAYAGIDPKDALSLTFANNIDSSITVLVTDIIGLPGAKLAALIIAISAFSATLSTIMPAARIVLTMATYQAIPSLFAKIDQRTHTPKIATWTIGCMTLFIYLILSSISEAIIKDAIHSVSIAVCAYYSIAALSCVSYFYRTAFQHWQTALSQVIFPAIGGFTLIAISVIQAYRMFNPDYGASGSIAGIGTVFFIGVATLLFGFVVMLLCNLHESKFFRGKTLLRKSDVSNL